MQTEASDDVMDHILHSGVDLTSQQQTPAENAPEGSIQIAKEVKVISFVLDRKGVDIATLPTGDPVSCETSVVHHFSSLSSLTVQQ